MDDLSFYTLYVSMKWNPRKRQRNEKTTTLVTIQQTIVDVILDGTLYQTIYLGRK